MNLVITTARLLHAYIRTGLKPLWGSKDWVDNPQHPTRACPVGVLCIEAGVNPEFIGAGSLYDRYDNEEYNVPWIDGFTDAWEKGDHPKGYSPETFSYQKPSYEEALEKYTEGFQRGQEIRLEFIQLGLRTA